MKTELIFLGPPACGKGTQTNRLSEYLGLPHIDTGSLLRAEIAKETEEGLVAKSFIDKGQLVPIDLVATIIGKKLSDEDCKNGYVLDGYPRSLEQAEKLDEINEMLHLKLEADDYDSIAGHIINLLEHLPSEGETVVDNNVQYTVQSIDKNRIDKIHILLLPEESTEESE